MIINESIQAEEVSLCLHCSSVGTCLYENMRDRLYEVPGNWSFLRCPKCGLVWINPRPLLEGIKRLYSNYYTHSKESIEKKLTSFKRRLKHDVLVNAFGQNKNFSSWEWARMFAKPLGMFPPFKRTVEKAIVNLNFLPNRRLLDVGCGSGEFLVMMRDLGWQVQGIEPDGQAAKIAREKFGLRVEACTLEEAKIPVGSFDVITVLHVLEHVPDPQKLIQECSQALQPEGRLVIVVPNLESLGHQVFKKCWLGLDPPRHLWVYSSRTLRTCAERAGLEIEKLYTIGHGAMWGWITSKTIKRKGKFREEDVNFVLALEGLFFYFSTEFASTINKNVGEEIILIGKKNKQNLAKETSTL